MSNRPSEFLKEKANQLAHFIASDNKDPEKISRLMRELDKIPPVAAGLEAPLLKKPQNTQDKKNMVGIWKPQLVKGKKYFVRDVKYKDEYEYWAKVQEIPPKGLKKRVVLLGESVARGYLLDPYFTPALALETFLNTKSDSLQAEVVDLARNDSSMEDIKTMVMSSFKLEPDALVIFAGNNWLNCFQLTEELMADMIKLLESEARFSGLRGLLERKYQEAVTAFVEYLNNLSGIYQAPIVLVIPGFNLMDFKSNGLTRLLPWPNGETRRWFQIKGEVERALDNGDIQQAELLSQEMIKLNEANPLGYEYLAQCKLETKVFSQAEQYLRKALDTAIFRLSDVPGCYSIIRETLQREASRYRLPVVDLSSAFKQCDSGKVPGKELFLDYCHLNVEGIHLAMAATAQRLFPLLTKEEIPLAHLLKNKKNVDKDVKARSHFFAAIHNAHRGDQPFEILYYHCLQALKNSEATIPVMKLYIDMATRHTVWTVNKSCEQLIASGQMDQYSLFLQPHNHYLMDIKLVDAMVEALKTAGINMEEQVKRLRIEEHGLKCGKIDLLESYYHLTSYMINPQPDGHFYRAFDASSVFYLVAEKDDHILLNLTFRIPGHNFNNEKLYLEVNDSIAAELPPSETWSPCSIRLPKNVLKDGINTLTLQWPRHLDIKDNNNNGYPTNGKLTFFKRMMYPVYGEIHTFTAEAGE